MTIDGIDHLVLTVRDSLTMSAMNRRPASADSSRILRNCVARSDAVALA